MTSKCLSLLTLTLSLSFAAFGQLTEIPISRENNNNSIKARTQEVILQLPFWEDFSQNTTGIPSDSLWIGSEDIFVNYHYAINPPSVGVATFDGLRADGTPYSEDPESSERNDALTSGFIDLSSYAPSDNIYLSFFYQYGGNGEMPDPADGDLLAVEFKNSEDQWTQVFVINDQEGIDNQSFNQAFVPVTNADYLHEDFQFTIVNYGNQSGPFDIFNVDYIYINTNRDIDDEFYPDRTVVEGLSNIFEDYASIPRAHLSFEDDYVVPFYKFRTLLNTFQTYAQQATISVGMADDTIVTNYPNTAQGTNTPIFEDEVDTVLVPFALTPEGFPEVDTSVYNITYEVIVKTYDNRIDSGNYEVKYEPIDFRVNDTINKSFVFEDYYAYDDGSAESSAGLEVTDNMLAYLFTLRNVDSAYVKAIDINTIYSGASGLGKNVDLHIWNSRNGIPGNELRKQPFTITGEDSRTGFTRYEFSKPILVKDSFFIGLTLKSSGRLPIGFDKSNNNADKIFEYVDDVWLSIENRISGTLMMRPVIGGPPVDPVTGIDRETGTSKIFIYPNPSADGIFYIKGNFQAVNVYDISGKKVFFDWDNSPGSGELRIYNSGIYVIAIETETGAHYRKVIVK